ncbi:unnamed protein product, partial [Ectocarpus fasciculatus]
CSSCYVFRVWGTHACNENTTDTSSNKSERIDLVTRYICTLLQTHHKQLAAVEDAPQLTLLCWEPDRQVILTAARWWNIKHSILALGTPRFQHKQTHKSVKACLALKVTCTSISLLRDRAQLDSKRHEGISVPKDCAAAKESHESDNVREKEGQK